MTPSSYAPPDDRPMTLFTNRHIVYGAPVTFTFIGTAIGMVVMVLLFYYFEAQIKTWAGFSPLAFGLLAVYLGIACVVGVIFKRRLAKMLQA